MPVVTCKYVQNKEMGLIFAMTLNHVHSSLVFLVLLDPIQELLSPLLLIEIRKGELILVIIT